MGCNVVRVIYKAIDKQIKDLNGPRFYMKSVKFRKNLFLMNTFDFKDISKKLYSVPNFYVVKRFPVT
jgi:hypothetical protein